MLNQVKSLSSHYLGVDSSLGLKGDKANRISRQSAHEGGKGVSPTHRPPLPLLIWVDPSEPIENRIRNLAACSTVSQPTAPPRASESR
jgi:hypothetical protein